MRTKPLLAALIVVLIFAPPAHAVLVSYSFDVIGGQVEDSLLGYGSGPLTDPVRVTLTYDSEVPGPPGGAGSEPGIRGDYSFLHQTIIATIGPHTIAAQLSGLHGAPSAFAFYQSNLDDADGWGGALRALNGIVVTGPLAGLPIDAGSGAIFLTDYDATVFVDEKLTVPFPTAGWDLGIIEFGFWNFATQDTPLLLFNLTNGVIDTGSLTSHVVPMPSSALLAGVTLLVSLVAARRRRRT